MNGALAVARYTLVELTRRRILLVFFIIGALGIAALATGLKLFSDEFVPRIGGEQGPTQDQLRQLTELSFVSDLLGVLGVFALLVAFSIGMTAIYHDIESGAAVAIFSKPVSRVAFTVGKIAAAVAGMIVIVGLLSVEARIAISLFGGGLEEALWFETLAGVANAVTLMLLVLALSTWMNNIVAAIVGFIYNGVAGVVVTLHQQAANGSFSDNGLLTGGLNVLYWLVPHALVSSAPREIVRREFEILNTSSQQGAPNIDQVLNGIPGPSGAGDIAWWAFTIVFFGALAYVAVRRRQV
jgi:ABC-type transport system involved in multi-copper enzyme maturation permease subunit